MNRIIGTMRRLDEQHGAVRVEDVYDTGIDDLWAAITQPARLARWVAAVEGEPTLGDTFRAAFTSGWEGPARVEACEAPDRLVVTLSPGADDETAIEARLTAEGDRTRLVVEERGLPLEVLHFHGAGWQAHLEDLARTLSGADSAWQPRWKELTPDYEAMVVS
ncbi:SRPBCC domain-containing protein [Leifsonia sp. NPDC058194]|uniref:SRPBCC domain-containing protein n=1 Tax=Leifsonia sp. NPDC058194 TaxID=3346374 RepID=UPI0036DC91C2